MTRILGRTIESAAGGHYATVVEEQPGRVSAIVWRRQHGCAAKRVDAWTLDCPFHIACDRVHAIVYPLPDADRA